MKVLFITNIPSPYRIDFYNELGKSVDLTVIFEAKGAEGIRFNWNINKIKNFKAIFLKEGNIKEKRIDWKILKYIKKNKYDEVVATSYSYFTEMVALICLKIKRIPYFLETDGGLIRDETIQKRAYKRFLVSNAKGYFSPSKSSDDYLFFYGAKREIIHRYPFTSLQDSDILKEVPNEKEKIELRQKLGLKEKKIILSVGQFIYRKGYDILLNVCKNLSNDIGIYIVGGKPTDEYLELKKNLNLDNVHFEGFKTKDELSEYYKTSDLFVLPTREDIWGLVINEAMAYGLPVITTDKCVAALELVKNNENGYIVSVNNIEEFVQKINEILFNEDLCRQMGEKSLKIIRTYTIENMSLIHSNVFYNQNINN